MSDSVAVIVTSISGPNGILSAIAQGCATAKWDFCLIGDRKSPIDFALPGSRFFDVRAQVATGFATAMHCPVNHYARKNIGYLIAIRDRASIIVETDDDNIPEHGFWSSRVRRYDIPTIGGAGWINPYQYFTDQQIWPRGLPLDAIRNDAPAFERLACHEVDCPIQQGLADDNPDVDAIYRLIFPDPIRFRRDRRVAIGRGTWCPFNSQNTTWWREAFALLYLPAFCSFRMTDIWRGFVAQRIAWENDWSVLFHEPTVRQERNAHDLMRDFSDEVPGYVNNRRIGEILESLVLRPSPSEVADNMRACYQALTREKSWAMANSNCWSIGLQTLRASACFPVDRKPRPARSVSVPRNGASGT